MWRESQSRGVVQGWFKLARPVVAAEKCSDAAIGYAVASFQAEVLTIDPEPLLP